MQLASRCHWAHILILLSAFMDILFGGKSIEHKVLIIRPFMENSKIGANPKANWLLKAFVSLLGFSCFHFVHEFNNLKHEAALFFRFNGQNDKANCAWICSSSWNCCLANERKRAKFKLILTFLFNFRQTLARILYVQQDTPANGYFYHYDKRCVMVSSFID